MFWGVWLRGLHRWGGTPKTIYSHNESALNSQTMQDLFKKHNIRHITTLTHASIAERQIRTIKAMLYPRVEHTNETWDKLIKQVLNQYNFKQVHSITGLTPDEARDSKNEMNVKLKLELQARHKRRYPTLNIGDSVKIFKKKTVRSKERDSVWGKESYTVDEIVNSMGQKMYRLSKGGVYLRHELLKVGV